MIAAAEVGLQRRMTAAFIAADAISLELVRNTQMPDGTGGYTDLATTRPAQTFRLNPLQDATGEQFNASGVAVTPRYMLIGAYDCDLERFDNFAFQDDWYQVVFIEANRQYQVKGEVAYVGGL